MNFENLTAESVEFAIRSSEPPLEGKAFSSFGRRLCWWRCKNTVALLDSGAPGEESPPLVLFPIYKNDVE